MDTLLDARGLACPLPAVKARGALAAVPPGDALVADVVYDERTGRIRSPEPLPDHLAIPTHVGAVRVRGEVLQAPSYVAVALIRVAQPATLAWRISGTAPYGLLEAGRPGVIRFYGAGLSPGAHCAALNLTAAADRAASWRIARGTRTLARGRLAPGATRTVAVPLPRLVERGFLDVAVRGTALQVSAISVDGGC
jgi:hypothetical protein